MYSKLTEKPTAISASGGVCCLGEKNICPKCSKENPTLVRYWNDQGDTREAVESGEIIYAAWENPDNKYHVEWHCMGCDYEWGESNPDNGSYRADYVKNNFLVTPKPTY